ncbi:hypothetical protein ACUTGN_26460, partial [Klebsiella pneumoniae]
GPDPRNFNQRVSLGRNDLLIRTFLSIEEFEYLMSSCKEHGRQPYEVLRYAVEMNRTPSQTVFLFIQHLEKFFGQVTKSEMIRKTGLDLLERMTENIPGLKQNVNLVNE